MPVRSGKKPLAIATTEFSRWKPLSLAKGSGAPGLSSTTETFQTWQGFGGCFNELGWIALQKLGSSQREAVLESLFAPSADLRFTYCRLPVGANDYADSWYSLNETPGDFAMKRFSIDRDKGCLIPYIKAAKKYRKAITLFASPWSPPTWMKNPPVYNYGRFVREKKYLDAYALYFVKFIKAYERAGIAVDHVHVQNEPCADQKFPSCLWSGAEMRDFIRDHLGPAFKKHGVKAKIWLGTLNSDDYNGYANTVLSDPACRQHIEGVGYQWGGRHAIERTSRAYPDMQLIQTENECGDGKNTWEYALYIFDIMRSYISSGASAYVYWNMILEPGGRSSWGWNQNAMVTIDPKKKAAIFNHEFFIMKHAARFIVPGAKRIGLTGSWCSNSFAFVNPDKSEVYCVCNPLANKRVLTIKTGSGIFKTTMEPRSVATIVV